MRLRTAVRQITDQSRKSYLRWMLRGHLAELDRRLSKGSEVPSALLEKLHRAWSNEFWSANSSFLSSMLQWFHRTEGAVLECGSGLSTLVLALAAKWRERQVLSLEHDPEWAQRVCSALPATAKSNSAVELTFIKNHGDFDWYSVDGIQFPSPIGFVVCDGPPGFTRGGRYGLAAVMRNQLAPGCIIMLDDTQRPDEQAILQRWCVELNATVVQEATSFSVLQVGRS